MLPAYDLQAPKRAVNLSINGDLPNKAKSLDIKLSATLEQALVEIVNQNQRKKWLEENRNAINAYNEYVETQGVFSDDVQNL